MDAHMLVRPTDGTVELSFSVERVQALAVDVLFFHLSDDADGLLPHGPEPFDQRIQRETIVFSGLGKVEPVHVEIRRRAWPPVRMSLQVSIHERYLSARAGVLVLCNPRRSLTTPAVAKSLRPWPEPKSTISA